MVGIEEVGCPFHYDSKFPCIPIQGVDETQVNESKGAKEKKMGEKDSEKSIFKLFPIGFSKLLEPEQGGFVRKRGTQEQSSTLREIGCYARNQNKSL